MLSETGSGFFFHGRELQKISPMVTSKAELVSGGVGHIAKEISKQGIEGSVWFSSCVL